MEFMTPNKLLKLWQQEEITTEMAIAYLIQNQIRQETTTIAANISWAKIRADVDRLIAHTGLEPESQAETEKKKGAQH